MRLLILKSKIFIQTFRLALQLLDSMRFHNRVHMLRILFLDKKRANPTGLLLGQELESIVTHLLIHVDRLEALRLLDACLDSLVIQWTLSGSILSSQHQPLSLLMRLNRPSPRMKISFSIIQQFQISWPLQLIWSSQLLWALVYVSLSVKEVEL